MENKNIATAASIAVAGALIFGGIALNDKELLRENETVRIQVTYTVATSAGEYKDAIYFTEEEYKDVTRDKLDAIQTERAGTWATAVETASKHEKTKEELEAEKQMFIEQEISAEQQKLEIQQKIDQL